ncbi:hypothetical protein EVAR_70117_1 [Eumeta japonica]|uniref:Uncharacterized protein n=1 Tax=Eumeta variegata TaxID=151549 RepID=A0A4C1Z7I1_EUMVA|nr:hypothetical protein EVAR_70117_1 [Eumeta japonica]
MRSCRQAGCCEHSHPHPQMRNFRIDLDICIRIRINLCGFSCGCEYHASSDKKEIGRGRRLARAGPT